MSGSNRGLVEIGAVSPSETVESSQNGIQMRLDMAQIILISEWAVTKDTEE